MRELFDSPTAYNSKVRRAWAGYWARFSFENWATFKGLYEKYGNLDLLGTTDDLEPKPCIILGSGPSFDDMIPHLKDWKGYIFCSTSQLSTLAYYGIEPDFCFLIDSDPTQLFLLDDYDGAGTKTFFCTHPSVPPAYFEKWKGKWKFFRMNEPSDGEGGFFSETLPYAYNDLVPDPSSTPENPKPYFGVRSYIMNAGCVPNSIIPFAMVRGMRPIFLSGIDFGYPGDQYRFTKAARVKGEWVKPPPPPIPPDIPIQLAENGVKTDKVCIFYKYASVLLWGLSGAPILSCSRGINYHLPYCDPKEVVERQGQGYEDKIIPHDQAYKTAQKYLERRGTFITKEGHQINTFTWSSTKGLTKVWKFLRYLWFRGNTDWENQLKRHITRTQGKLQRVVERMKKDGIPQDRWEQLINLPPDQRAFTIKSIKEDMYYARLAEGKIGSGDGGNGDLRAGSNTVSDGPGPVVQADADQPGRVQAGKPTG
mgnify:CR=1 FL=1